MRIWAKEAAREILVLVVHKPHPTQIELARITWEHYLQRGLDLLVPSRVFALACRLKPRRFSSRPTSFWPAVKPNSASAADR